MIELSNAEIGTISAMADGSVKVVLYTPEMSAEDMTALFNAKKQGISAVSFPEDKAEPKSKSERLKNVLYRLWEQEISDKQKMSFELYYNDRMERLINSVKDKLN